MIRQISGVLCLAGMAWAAAPIGSVASTASFRLRGAEVQTAGVPSWPVRAGDEIVAGAKPVMVTLAGGSRVYVNAGSRVKLAVEGKQTVLRLLDGDVAYQVAAGAPVSVAARALDALPAASAEGSLSILNGAAVWAPAQPGQFAAANGLFQGYRVTPFNLDFVQNWRGNEAPFGRPPGVPPGQTNPPNPPGPPPGRPPVSISR